jgi:hypothetical protein
MLRLGPSEITLTPVDVEETRRRIARRKAAVAPIPRFTSRAGGPRLTVHRPRALTVRQGAERSRDDALSPLSNIPVLRPHQAMNSSLESDADDQPYRRDSHWFEIQNDIDDVQVPLSESSLQLPFRPLSGQDNGRQHTSVGNTESDTSSVSPKQRSKLSTFPRRTNTSNDAGGGFTSQLESSTDGFIEVKQASNYALSASLGEQGTIASPRPPDQSQHVSSSKREEARRRAHPSRGSS